ncbi:MAG: hypothetical protein RJB26_2241 [Pseudomonadota bacterium]
MAANQAPPPIYMGIDGCRSGWVAAVQQGADVRVEIHPTFGGLLAAYPLVARIAVDMPIGLPYAGYEKRECESLARGKLPGRASTVFSPPCRAAANAATIAEARELNRQEVGSSLSAQAWNICRKIVEVDDALAAAPAIAKRVFEVHPEVCFAALADGRPMAHRKSTAEGRGERLAWLSRWLPQAAALSEAMLANHPRYSVLEDDILDALVVLLVARADEVQLKFLPPHTVRDERGLPMRIAYWEPA